MFQALLNFTWRTWAQDRGELLDTTTLRIRELQDDSVNASSDANTPYKNCPKAIENATM